MADLAAKYAFLGGLYVFVLFVLVHVVRALNRAAGLERSKAGKRSQRVSAPPILLLGDRQIPLPPRGELVIGRAEDCGLVLGDPFVSHRHAAITSEGGPCWLRDLGSTNGTRVNGQPVQQAQLRDGDRIEVGGTTMVFRSGG